MKKIILKMLMWIFIETIHINKVENLKLYVGNYLNIIGYLIFLIMIKIFIFFYYEFKFISIIRLCIFFFFVVKCHFVLFIKKFEFGVNINRELISNISFHFFIKFFLIGFFYNLDFWFGFFLFSDINFYYLVLYFYTYILSFLDFYVDFNFFDIYKLNYNYNTYDSYDFYLYDSQKLQGLLNFNKTRKEIAYENVDRQIVILDGVLKESIRHNYGFNEASLKIMKELNIKQMKADPFEIFLHVKNKIESNWYYRYLHGDYTLWGYWLNFVFIYDAKWYFMKFLYSISDRVGLTNNQSLYYQYDDLVKVELLKKASQENFRLVFEKFHRHFFSVYFNNKYGFFKSNNTLEMIFHQFSNEYPKDVGFLRGSKSISEWNYQYNPLFYFTFKDKAARFSIEVNFPRTFEIHREENRILMRHNHLPYCTKNESDNYMPLNHMMPLSDGSYFYFFDPKRENLFENQEVLFQGSCLLLSNVAKQYFYIRQTGSVFTPDYYENFWKFMNNEQHRMINYWFQKDLKKLYELQRLFKSCERFRAGYMFYWFSYIDQVHDEILEPIFQMARNKVNFHDGTWGRVIPLFGKDQPKSVNCDLNGLLYVSFLPLANGRLKMLNLDFLEHIVDGEVNITDDDLSRRSKFGFFPAKDTLFTEPRSDLMLRSFKLMFREFKHYFKYIDIKPPFSSIFMDDLKLENCDIKLDEKGGLILGDNVEFKKINEGVDIKPNSVEEIR